MNETEMTGFQSEEEAEAETEFVHPKLLAEYGLKQKEAESYHKGELILEDDTLNAQLHTLGVFPQGITFEITAYNASEPIIVNGEKLVLARVEPKGNGDAESVVESEAQSFVCVFREKEEGGWELVETPPLHLQDPFYCGVVEGKHIFGGVETNEENIDGRRNLGYRTVLYSFDNTLNEAKEMMTGPDRMKGIRFIERNSKEDPDKKIITVLYRSQGEVGDRGEIGFFNVSTLDEANEIFRQMEAKEMVQNPDGKMEAKLVNPDLQRDGLIKDLCGTEEWVGGNEMHLLVDGNIGVLGHLAYDYPDPARRMDLQNPSMPLDLKRYVATAMIINPDTKEIIKPMEIICTAEDFPPVVSKKVGLDKILYPGGLVRNGDGTAILYGGIGDAKAGRRTIEDPFWKYEQALNDSK